VDDTHEAYRRFHRRRHKTLLELLAKHVSTKGRRCLDIGSGGDVAGAGSVILERYAEELHTVDQGADVTTGQEKGLSTKRCDVDNEPLPYGDGYFDIVLFASVIEHLYNPYHALAEIARVLAENGLLFLEAPNATALGRRLDALAGKNPFGSFNRHNAVENKSPMAECSVFYTASELESALQPWFRLIERRYAMHDPPVNPLKGLLREAAFRANSRLADCFFVVARRRDRA
jgi:ubiquinone/menaquinone biosynthesis C-methylase UbiE